MSCPGTNDSHLGRAFHPDPTPSPPAARDPLTPAVTAVGAGDPEVASLGGAADRLRRPAR